MRTPPGRTGRRQESGGTPSPRAAPRPTAEARRGDGEIGSKRVGVATGDRSSPPDRHHDRTTGQDRNGQNGAEGSGT